MLEKDLQRLGLNKNEVSIYIALLESEKKTAGELIKKTGIHRNLVYQSLYSLAEKRLITKITTGSAAIFKATDPSHLFDAVREQELAVERVMNELKEKQKLAGQEITIYEGDDGIRAYCLKNAENLKHGQYIYVIGTGGPRLEKAMGAQALKKYFSLIEQNGGIRVLAYRAQQYTENMYALIQNKSMFQFRILPTQIAPVSGVIFTDESVGFVVYEGSVVVIEVKNTYLVAAHKQYFELLWNEALEIAV